MAQTTFNQRFKILINSYHLSDSDVARKMKVDRQMIANYQRKTQPTVEKIAMIVEAFSDVSLEWLVLGTGQMLKENHENIAAEPAENYRSFNTDVLMKLWEQDRSELIRLRELNQQLTQKLLSSPENNNQSKTA